MAKRNPHHLPDNVHAELEACGLPWEAKYGGKRTKIFVAGRMVGAVRCGGKEMGDKPGMNVISAIRRLKREGSGHAHS